MLPPDSARDPAVMPLSLEASCSGFPELLTVRPRGDATSRGNKADAKERQCAGLWDGIDILDTDSNMRHAKVVILVIPRSKATCRVVWIYVGWNQPLDVRWPFAIRPTIA